jgi:pyruvate,water dikinase
MDLAATEQQTLVLSEDQAAQLARWSLAVAAAGGGPQDIEWALARDGRLLLLQAQPLHVRERDKEGEEQGEVAAEVLLSGGKKAAGGAGAGPVFLAVDRDLREIGTGSVLVTAGTPPSLVRVMDKLAAVVADRGSSAGHFATVCREFGVPLLVNTGTATTDLAHGQEVTVDADRLTVYAGRVEELLGRRPPREDLPYFKKLRAILDFITPLKLVDAASDDFQPSSCRSFHDIIRYTHEQAVQAMFAMGDKVSGRSGRCRKLATDLPLEVYLLDVGEGICPESKSADAVSLQDICSQPFRALWKGLSHPGVDWEAHAHFDWKSFDDIALAGGVATAKSGDFASYAIISRDYLNLNMRFGYHFTLVDALCGDDARANYCQLRFAGGGGDYSGKSLRIEFLTAVLTRLGLEVSVRADLLDARRNEATADELCDILDQLGRLLGASKLMDMVLREGVDVDEYVQRFFNGIYNFSGST